ncbi:MAG: hypothetical protein HY078_02755 [Elusimicrobia bacterium]|nr:hypothetical protein [Elusimicrobiota bacterium]
MIKSLTVFLGLLAVAPAAFACDRARTDEVISQVVRVENEGSVVEETDASGRASKLVFHSAAGELDENGQPKSRRACYAAASRRLMSGQDDQSTHVACVSRPGPQGGVATALTSIQHERVQDACNAMNVCLFELTGRETAEPHRTLYNRLGKAWDDLGCHGH